MIADVSQREGSALSLLLHDLVLPAIWCVLPETAAHGFNCLLIML